MKTFMLLIIWKLAFAVVPVADVTQQAQDTSTMAHYSAQVRSSLNKIGKLMSAADQVKNLQGLQKLQAGTALCELCTNSDREHLQAYMNSINSDLCSQFSLAYTNITGIKTSVQHLDQVMSMFATNPKAATIALQQAQIASTYATNNTLAQMQMLQAQAAQKQMAQEKVSQQTYAAAIKGASHVSY